jgi:uracil-DNA glycosylase
MEAAESSTMSFGKNKVRNLALHLLAPNGTMANFVLAQRLIDALPASRPGLFNPWRDWCDADDRSDSLGGPVGRVGRLAAHLDCEPRYIICGQSPGWRGCRYSGVAFSSERQVLDGVLPRVPAPSHRLTRCSPTGAPITEPSASIMWNTLHALGVAKEVVLWNALQMHPHRPAIPWSNRTPSQAEMELGAPALEILLDAFPDAKVISVGTKSENLLRVLDLLPNGQLKHPAYGGARQFAEHLRCLL